MQNQSTMIFCYDLANELHLLFELAANGLSFLPRCKKCSVSKFQSLLFVGSISFLYSSHSFVEMVYDGFLKPLGTPTFAHIAAAT